MFSQYYNPETRFPYRRRWYLILTLTLAFATLCFAGKRDDEIIHDFPAKGIESVDVENINGNIKITGSNRSDIHIVANRFVRYSDDKIGDEFCKEFKPVIEINHGILEIETHRPELTRQEQDHINEASISYVIEVPSSLSAEVETINGNIDIAELTGFIDIETVNGKIDIDVDAAVEEDIDAETVNGSIKVALTSVEGDCSFETVNGSVDLTVRMTVGGDISAETVNGSVDLLLPDQASFTLDVETGFSGDIRSDWGKPSSMDDNDTSFEMEINGGGKLVEVETLNGSIAIKKRM